MLTGARRATVSSSLMCFCAPTPHPSAARNDARNYTPCTALVVQSGWIWREDIWLVGQDETTHRARGLHDAPVSKLACWPCVQALQDRLPSAHMLTYPLAWQPGRELREVPQGTLLLALGICGCWQPEEVIQSWHVALHTCGSQELEERAGHPLSRSVLSSLCPLLLWHQHLPTCVGVTGQME